MSTLWFDLICTYTLVHHYSCSSCNKTSLKKWKNLTWESTQLIINCSPPAPTREGCPPNPRSVVPEPPQVQLQSRVTSEKSGTESSSDVKRVSCTLIMLPGRRRSKVTLWEQVQPMHFARSGWRGDELRERKGRRDKTCLAHICLQEDVRLGLGVFFPLRAASDSVRGNHNE